MMVTLNWVTLEDLYIQMYIFKNAKTHFAIIPTLNNLEMITETQSYILR